MPKPYQKGGPPISISLASPHSSSARTAALQRLQNHLGEHHADLLGGVALGDLQQSVRGSRQTGFR